MQNKIDEGRFRELLEESDDLQSDAMRTARTNLNDYVEAAREACVSAGRDASRWGTAAAAAGVPRQPVTPSSVFPETLA